MDIELSDCWAYEKSSNQPCWGKMTASYDYPDAGVFYCEGHGHPEDQQEYKPSPDAADATWSPVGKEKITWYSEDS